LEMSMPYKTVVDLGAGHGTDLQLAREINSTAKLFAIEAYPPYVKELERQQVVVHAADIERDRFPFEDESVDVLIANQVLEHTKDVFWLFHEMSRVLAVGGNLIIGVPNLAALHNRVLLLLGRQPSPIKTASAHVRGFTKLDLLSFVNDCFQEGYDLKKFGGSNFYPFPACIARPLAKQFPSMAWGIFFLLQKKRRYRREFLEFPERQQLETNFYLGSNC
jgi:SAM-dependent methyltransferase